jgi:hypothetical protein
MSALSSGAAAPAPPSPPLHFLLTNISKIPNIRALLSTCILHRIPTLALSSSSLFKPSTMRARLLPASVGKELGLREESPTDKSSSKSSRVYENDFLCVVYGEYKAPASPDATLIHLPNLPPELVDRYEAEEEETPPSPPSPPSPSSPSPAAFLRPVVSLATAASFIASRDCLPAAPAVLGIEILPPFDPRPSYTLATLPPVAPGSPKLLMLGNEGSGMTDKQIGVCDEFVCVEQYGGATASFNVNVAYNIVAERLANLPR